MARSSRSSTTKTGLVIIGEAGIFGVSEALQAFGREAKRELFEAVTEEIHEVAREAQEEVPVITTHLADSMRVNVRQRPAVYGEIKFLADYALYVHEVPRPESSTGKWHYLSDPLARSKKALVKNVAARLQSLVRETSRKVGGR